MLRRLQRPVSGAFSAYVCPSCRIRSARQQSTAVLAHQAPTDVAEYHQDTGPKLPPDAHTENGGQEDRGRHNSNETTTARASSGVVGEGQALETPHEKPKTIVAAVRQQSPRLLRRRSTKSIETISLPAIVDIEHVKRGGRRIALARRPQSHWTTHRRRISTKPLVRHVQSNKTKRPGDVRRATSGRAEAIDINKVYKSLESDTINDSEEQNGSAENSVKDVEKLLNAHLRGVFAEANPRRRAGKAANASQAVKGIRRITASKLDLQPITNIDQPPVPRLHHGLDRVLFNPGVYQLQDPRTRVFNFDPYLHKILPVDQFNFKALQEYETSSKDKTLAQIAADHRIRYYGSTSSMTGMLRHFHFLLSQSRPLNFSMLTQAFEVKNKNFSKIAKTPAAVFLRYVGDSKPSRYAIDADKFFDGMNIMSLLGHSLEKLLTCPVAEFEEYRLQKDKEPYIPSEPPRNSYNYTKMDDMLMRSQLDAADPRLPGTGVFDVKTRAVVSVRAHAFDDHRPGLGYEIKQEFGQWESFEREQYDMLRTTMLGYSLQARMGRMDGIFAAYHNIERIFGFQYFGLEDLDLGLHGQRDRSLGDQEFKISVSLLKTVFDKATKKFPKQTLRMHFEARGTPIFLYVYAEPLSEEEADAIQSRNKEKNAKITRDLLYPDTNDDVEPEEEDADAWAELRDRVESDIRLDEAHGGSSLPDVVDENDQSDDEEQLSFEHRLLRLQVSAEKVKTMIQVNLHSFEQAKDEEGSKISTKLHKEIRANVAYLLQLRLKLSTVANQINSEQGDESKLMFFVHHIEQTLDKQILEVADLEKSLVPRKHRKAAEETTRSHQSTDTTEEKTAATADNEASTGQAEVDDVSPTEEGPQMDHDDAATVSPPKADRSKPLLVMTVTIRNKVNGLPVKRPENLTDSDMWDVEYSVDEVQNAEQAWALYEACQARRGAQLDHDGEARKGLRVFQREVREWAKKGMAWRAKQEEEEQQKGVEVFEAFDKGWEK